MATIYVNMRQPQSSIQDWSHANNLQQQLSRRGGIVEIDTDKIRLVGPPKYSVEDFNPWDYMYGIQRMGNHLLDVRVAEELTKEEHAELVPDVLKTNHCVLWTQSFFFKEDTILIPYTRMPKPGFWGKDGIQIIDKPLSSEHRIAVLVP